MKALVGAFNQEKALVGAFSVIVQPVVDPMDRFAALVPSITLPVGDSLWWRRDEYCGGSLILIQYLPSVSSRSLASSPLTLLLSFSFVVKLLAGKIYFEELTFPFRSVTWPRGGRIRRGRSWRGRRTRWTSFARRSPRTRTSWTWRRWGRRCWYRGASFCHSS